MKKVVKSIFLLILNLFFVSVFAQSDEDLFGSADDDLFGDDGIIEITETEIEKNATTDLSKGILFQTGSMKIGGAFDMTLTALTTFQNDFAKSLSQTYLIPVADASLYVDAHPTDNLRLYGKTGVHYPYVSESTATLVSKNFNGNNIVLDASSDFMMNLFYIKELFADFNLGQNVAFRFGKQTVSWGVGYFYSPADVINLSRIDPEKPDAQVEGPLALRSQIVFPGSQNAIWAYVIPENKFENIVSGAGSYLRDTAVALKGDIVIQNWELGLGGWYKYQNSPKLMMTLTGTLFSHYSVFGEAVLSFGQDTVINDYTPVFQGTAGVMRTWSKQNISIAVQYYYNGQVYSVPSTHGNNLAGFISFGKVIISDLSASIFAQYNFDNISGTAYTTLTYKPIKEFGISAGPYFVITKERFIPSAKLTFTLGSGKF